MNSPQEIDPITAILLIFSSVGFLLGIITILFFMTEAFYNFNCWFFSISLINQIFCLYFYYQDSDKHYSRPIKFNPYFHNALSFFLFAISWTTSIFYIIDTIFLHLSTLVQFLPRSSVKSSLEDFVKSKAIINFSVVIEILVVPEMLLWFLFTFRFRIIFTAIFYIFNILMFGYVCLDPLAKKFQSIYKYIKKNYSNSDGFIKTVLGFTLSLSDALSDLSKEIYKLTIYLN